MSAAALLAAAWIIAGHAGCSSRPATVSGAASAAMSPVPMPAQGDGQAQVQDEGVWQSVPARMADTRRMRHAPEILQWDKHATRTVREALGMQPPQPTVRDPISPSEGAQAGLMLEEDRAHPLALFPGPSQTEWRPPDPTLAVGPSHVVSTVNMAFTIHDKATGQLQFANTLNDYGDPGLFETQGAGWFTFDPLCVYDHVAQRFVIIALETYAEPFGAWVNIAISDDSDPHGVWYVYRTPANTGTAWWDYPGLGYDTQAWYVTSTLIGGSGSGLRIFSKASMLSGGPAQFITLGVPFTTVRPATHFGSNPAAYAVADSGSTSITLLAVSNPLTSPVLVQSPVTVATVGQGATVPTPTDTIGNLVGRRMQNAVWRNGRLYAAHGNVVSGRGVARWYELATNAWPASGAPTLLQTGNVDPGPGLHVFFPTISVNAQGEAGMMMNLSGTSTNPAVAVTGRLATDPPGAMGPLRIVQTGTVSEGGRWGDYSGIAVDPVDDRTFWGIAEYKTDVGWQNWITSFGVAPPGVPVANIDDVGNIAGGASITIDVLANDLIIGGPPTLALPSSTSALGGSLQRLPGAGPNGRDLVRYTAPASIAGTRAQDIFTYTLTSSAGQAQGIVRATAWNPARFLKPGTPVPASAPSGLRAALYALNQPTSFPDFALVGSPIAQTTLTDLSFDWGTGPVLSSGRSDGVGLVAQGVFVAPSTGVYSFWASASEGVRVFVGGRLVVDNSGPNSSALERQDFVGLVAGPHDVRIEYYERWERASLGVAFAVDGGPRQALSGRLRDARICDTLDFNNDAIEQDPTDIEAFLSVYSGGPCLPHALPALECNDLDFNNDGIEQDPTDLEAFLSVYSGGACV